MIIRSAYPEDLGYIPDREIRGLWRRRVDDDDETRCEVCGEPADLMLYMPGTLNAAYCEPHADAQRDALGGEDTRDEGDV